MKTIFTAKPPSRQENLFSLTEILESCHSWRLGVLAVNIVVLFLAVGVCWSKTSTKPKVTFPSLILYEKNKNIVAHESKGVIDWEYTADGPLKDVQPQPNGYFLVTGGSKKVFLLRKVSKGCRVIWDWSGMDSAAIESAVAVDWDLTGNPSLILAADSKTNRLFLAEAKSDQVKTRWEYKLTAPPRKVHVCPDTGNFLVVLRDSTVEEIQFQEDKVVWAIGKINKFKNIQDAIRDPWARTYVADAGSGSIICLEPGQNRAWETHLPFAPGSFEEISLSLLRQGSRRMVLASVRFSGDRNILYLLNSETGKVVAWKDRLEKGSYPTFLKAVPDKAAYYQKQ